MSAASPPAGIDARLLELAEELRGEGVRIGTSELLDAFAALAEVGWRQREAFQGALAATLAKSPEDRRVFDLVFERFFFRAVEAAALREGVREWATASDGGDARRLDLDELRAQIAEALADFDEARMRDLARLAVAALARDDGSGSGVVGIDVQRIRRALGLRREGQLALGDGLGLPREALQQFEAMLRRELERAQIERTETLAPARPLGELDRALPSGPAADLAAVHRVVAQLRRRLATTGGGELRGRQRHDHIDFRRTVRSSLQTGGVPIVIKTRRRRPRRPELYVLCDVSTSVTSASVFFLSVLHALHDSFRRMRSFVFIERVSEVTDVFARERAFSAVSAAIARDAGVADVSGYTDYGRVWSEFRVLVEDDLDPRANVIVLGDARTNGRDPRAGEFAALAARARRAFWLNPEPRLYWNYGDSVIAAYAPYCEVFECWTTRQLEDFVKSLTTTAPS